MKKSPAKKGKKKNTDRMTAHDALCNDFFLGDIAFTLLPIGIIAILRWAFGMLDSSILFLSEWAFASIIISSLALTRVLELKVIHQKDTSWSVLFLSRICILLIILSTLCLALYTLKEQGIKVDEQIVIKFQFILLIISSLLLCTAHYYREYLILERKEFSKAILARDFHWYSFDNLMDSRGKIRATCAAFDKSYDFFEQNNDIGAVEEYGKRELERLIEDMQSDLSILKGRMEKWDKPPYSKSVTPESSDNID